MKTTLWQLGLFLALAALIAVGCGEREQPVTDVPPDGLPETAVPPTEPVVPAEPIFEEVPEVETTGPEATIYRTEWGVPHIYSDSLEAAMYAFGYAQAEDRLDEIMQNTRTALGLMSEAFGKEHIELDYQLRLFRNPEVAQEAYETAPERIRLICDAYTAGIKAYMEDYPERVPDYAIDLEPWHGVAVGRTIILQWPLGTIRSDLRRRHEDPGTGSNGWAVSPSRSAEDCAILLTDPHLTWQGIQVFYEARIHAEEFDINGHFVVGAPMMGLGHNANVAWACTTGGPDTSDVYELKINPENPLQYELDGEWKQAEVVMIEFDVKDADPFQRPAVYTEWGPYIEEPKDGVGFAGATPYFNAKGLIEQVYRMCTAQNCDEFYEALGMNEFMEQNIIFADTEGNIQYVRTGRTPIRPEGYNWSAPVPGHTTDTKWLGIHDIDDLVQIKNPPIGYMQNCNISPAVMLPDSPMTPDKYPDYIYNVSWDSTNMRGERALQLLAEFDSMTVEQAIALSNDVYDRLAKPWQKALDAAIAAGGEDYMENADYATAVEAMLAWDGNYRPESKGAPIMKFWRLRCQRAVDVQAIADEAELGAEDLAKMAELLEETVDELKQTFGTIDLAWGDVHVVGRGDTYVGCGGDNYGSGPNSTTTLRSVTYRESEELGGKHVAFRGSFAMMLMFMHPDGVQSYSVVSWGNSSDPESPHYMDQGRDLFGPLKFKETYFQKEDLLNNVVSEKVITLP